MSDRGTAKQVIENLTEGILVDEVDEATFPENNGSYGGEVEYGWLQLIDQLRCCPRFSRMYILNKV